MNRAQTLTITATVMILVGAAAWLNMPPSTLDEEDSSRPIIRNITIGVIPDPEEALPTYRFLSSLAQEDINKYCYENKLGVRFRFNLSNPVMEAPPALQYSKASWPQASQ